MSCRKSFAEPKKSKGKGFLRRDWVIAGVVSLTLQAYYRGGGQRGMAVWHA